MSELTQDVERNRGNTKGLVIVLSFRLAAIIQRFGGRCRLCRIIAAIFVLPYKVLIDYVMGVYIAPATQIGPGFQPFHGVGIVINEHAVIGRNCTIRQNVTIGAKVDEPLLAPRIGNDVDIGAGAIIIGGIDIGDGARIGAGAVVVKDVPAGARAVGNPARIL